MTSDSRDPGESAPVSSDSITGAARVRRFSFRRNLLFVVTLVTIVLVYLGAMPWAGRLAGSPLAFASYWAVVFILVAFVLGLAIYDLARVRRDHERRVRDLDKELAAVAAEARELMRLHREALEEEDPRP